MARTLQTIMGLALTCLFRLSMKQLQVMCAMLMREKSSSDTASTVP